MQPQETTFISGSFHQALHHIDIAMPNDGRRATRSSLGVSGYPLSSLWQRCKNRRRTQRSTSISRSARPWVLP